MVRSLVIEGEEHRGGVAVLYKHSIARFVHHLEMYVDQVWFQISLIPNTWFGACYIAPRDSPFFSHASFSRIQEYCAKGPLILMGDLNARMPNLNIFESDTVHYSENPDRGSNANGTDIISLCENFALVPINHRRTPSRTYEGGFTFRQGQTWISQLDWVLCSRELAGHFIHLTIHQGGFPQSDHAPISFSISTTN